jgi:hypothetical protein
MGDKTDQEKKSGEGGGGMCNEIEQETKLNRKQIESVAN